MVVVMASEWLLLQVNGHVVRREGGGVHQGKHHLLVAAVLFVVLSEHTASGSLLTGCLGSLFMQESCTRSWSSLGSDVFVGTF